MAKYVKKPIVIEAFQWTGTDSLADQPEWLVNAMIKGIARVEDTDRKLRIHTREGIMTADIGDYIIRGVKGEIYPCKPDIFEMTYSPIEEPTK